MIGIAALIKDGKIEEAAKLKKELDEQVKRVHPPYCNLIDSDDEEKSIVHALNRGGKQSDMIRFFFDFIGMCCF